MAPTTISTGPLTRANLASFDLKYSELKSVRSTLLIWYPDLEVSLFHRIDAPLALLADLIGGEELEQPGADEIGGGILFWR